MAEVRLTVKGLAGWEDPSRVARILRTVPAVDEVSVDAASGQAWARGRGHLPLLGMLEALHAEGYHAEPATEKSLFPTIFSDEQQVLRRLRGALLWTFALLLIDMLIPREALGLLLGMLVLLAFLLSAARPLWTQALTQLRRRRWGEAPRVAMALWLLTFSIPLTWRNGDQVFFSLPAIVGTLLLLSRWLELRWRRLLRSSLGEENPHADHLLEALGGADPVEGNLKRLGGTMALALPILAGLWLVMVLLIPTRFHLGDILRGLAAILLAGGTRGLILALPSVMAAGLVRSNSRGLVFRRANILQHFHKVKLLVTDRVGVLTRRQAEVEKVKIIGSTSTERIYVEAAGALSEAAHPLLQALHRFLSERAESESRPLSVIRRPGGGLEAEIAGRILLVGHPWFLEREGVNMDESKAVFDNFGEEGLSIVALAVDGKMRAVFGLRVDARPEAPSMLRRIKEMGISIMLLTGEGRELARRVAESHDIDEYHGVLGSEERARVLREKAQGGVLAAALGIGNHDAPVLAAADFPVSLGPDAPSEKPGLLIASGRPAELLDALAFSAHTDSLVRQNFWLAGGLVVLSLLLAFSGILGPLGCAAMRVIAVQAPLANSLRTHSFRFESNSS